jgi:4-hydroxyproline epimerase
MCGHGTIGTITIAIEEGLITPKIPGKIRMEAPAGLVLINYQQEANGKVSSVKLTNVGSFLYKEGLEVTCPDLGTLTVDVAYGGNFYAIVDPQENFQGIDYHTADQLISWSRELRKNINAKYSFQHPEIPAINWCSHILWTGTCLDPSSTARNAVFYGDKAIDRSPCGTGTSARLAQWYAKGKLKQGDTFIHESFIGSKFKGTIEGFTKVGDFEAIIPGIEGWAKIYGYNTILVDPEDDPYAAGFQVI